MSCLRCVLWTSSLALQSSLSQTRVDTLCCDCKTLQVTPPSSLPPRSFLPLSLLSPSSFLPPLSLLPPSIPSLSFLPSPSLLPPSLPPLSFLYFSLPLSLLRLSFFTFSDVHPICSSFFSPFDPFYSPLFDPSLLPFLPVSLSLTSAQLFPLIVLFPSLSSLFFLLL